MTLLQRVGAGLILVAAAGAAAPSCAAAQTAKDLIGTWTLVSVIYEKDGKTTQPYGAHPKGLMTLGADERFTVIIVNSDLPKFAANSRMGGTAEEDKAVVQGSLAYFGTYSASAAEKTWTVHVEGATFPNWLGTTRSRNFSIQGDELTITNKGGASGVQGASATVVWKRVQ
jgi:hypothetical protein